MTVRHCPPDSRTVSGGHSEDSLSEKAFRTSGLKRVSGSVLHDRDIDRDNDRDRGTARQRLRERCRDQAEKGCKG